MAPDLKIDTQLNDSVLGKLIRYCLEKLVTWFKVYFL